MCLIFRSFMSLLNGFLYNFHAALKSTTFFTSQRSMPVPKVLINSIPNVSTMRKNVYLLTNQDATHFMTINPELIMADDELIRNKKTGLTKNIGMYLKLGGLPYLSFPLSFC